MSFNGSGTFVINSSGQPVVANTVVSTTVFNALTADLATGLSTCITKDGQTTPTANIPMGTFKFTNLGVGSAATDSATLGQVQASTTKLVTVTGTDTITGTLSPALTAYTAGQMFYFVAGGANTGAVTLNIDGLGSRNMTREGSVALVAGDILSGEVCVVVYDGTRFQLLNPASYTNLNVTGVLALAAGTALLPSLAFTGDLNTGVWSPAADTLAASTGGSERLRVDSSGNVGIGTSSPAYKLHVERPSYGVTGYFFTNDGTRNPRLVIYGSADGTTLQHTYSTAAGNLIFANGGAIGVGNEVGRFDASGNLGIGTASPARRLDIRNSGNAVYANVGNYGGDNAGALLLLSGSSTTKNWFIGNQFNVSGALEFTQSTSNGGTSIAAAPSMILNASGNLSLAEGNAPTQRLSLYATGSTAQYMSAGNSNTGLNGTLFGVDTAGNAILNQTQNFAMIFSTNNTERARVNANGQFAASTSLAGSNLVSFNNSSATGYGISVTVNNNSSGTYRFFEGVDSGPTQRIAIYTNGDVKNTNGVFAAFSDVKLKKDIVDAGSQWDDIKALRVRKYKLKDDAESIVQIGLIAQEVEQVSPGLVNESQDETKDEDGQIVLTGEVTKGVKYSILYMKAVKALQEAMARIETLEAKVTALESK